MFSTQKTKSPIRLQTFILSYIHQNISLCAESINGFTPAVRDLQYILRLFPSLVSIFEVPCFILNTPSGMWF